MLFSIDLKSLIDYRQKHVFRTMGDKCEPMIDEALNVGAEDFAVITYDTDMESLLRQYSGQLQGFYICGIFQLGKIIHEPLADTMVYSLYILSKKQPSKVKISTVPPSLENDFTFGLESDGYFNAIEKWVNTSKKEAAYLNCFNEVDPKYINLHRLNANLYSKKLHAFRMSLQGRKVVPLKDVADIIIPSSDSSAWNRGLYLLESNFKYPLDERNLEPRWSSQNCKVQCGDIVVCYGGKSVINAYLVYFCPVNDILICDDIILTNTRYCILRIKSKNVTPEYLYFCLNSEKTQNLLKLYFKNGCLAQGYLNSLPILLPKTEMPMGDDPAIVEEYRQLFKAIQNGNGPDIQYCGELARKLSEQRKDADLVLEEIVERFTEGPSNSYLSEFIHENMAEMNIAITSGVFRSAVVMACAILESVLIEWASEICGENLFQQPFHKDGRERDKITLDEAIVFIGKSVYEKSGKAWSAMKFARRIQQMRNEIHPAVFLHRGSTISKRDCEEAVSCLREVLSSWANFNSK